ncbi:MAG: DUF222 domain-containing protein, partial [Pseudonocardiaceae bacterium]
LERVGGFERVVSWVQAHQLRQIAAFIGHAQARYTRPANRSAQLWDSEMWNSAVAEVALMLRVSTRTAAWRVDEAVMLVGRLPAALAALEAGTISLAAARAIAEETINLGAAALAEVQAEVLARAGTQTPGQIRSAARRAVLRVDPTAARVRHEQAKAQRGVWLHDDPDGMATLLARLPAAEAVGVFAVIDEHARRAAACDDRTADARRADALVDLVFDGIAVATQTATPADGSPTETDGRVTDSGPAEDGPTEVSPHTQAGGSSESAEPSTNDTTRNSGDSGEAAARDDGDSAGDGNLVPFTSAGTARARGLAPLSRRGRRDSRVQVQVRVTVPFSMLLGLDEQPAELAGYGPLPAHVARQLAADGVWRRILTDPA